MSGPIVKMLGGPLDGQERHAVTYKLRQEVLFESAGFAFGNRVVHVYRSVGGSAPFEYCGMRIFADGDVVNPYPK